MDRKDPRDMRAYQAKYRADNREQLNARSAKRRADIRQQFFDMYGSVCAICGIDNPFALTLDHINGGGRAEKNKAYRLAISEYTPDKYRTLCHTCQQVEWQTR